MITEDTTKEAIDCAKCGSQNNLAIEDKPKNQNPFLENQESNDSDNLNQNNGVGSEAERPKHKGILKIMGENKGQAPTAGSNPNNMFKTFSFNDNNLSFNGLPTESTPKSLHNQNKDQQGEKTASKKDDELPEQQLVYQQVFYDLIFTFS